MYNATQHAARIENCLNRAAANTDAVWVTIRLLHGQIDYLVIMWNRGEASHDTPS